MRRRSAEMAPLAEFRQIQIGAVWRICAKATVFGKAKDKSNLEFNGLRETVRFARGAMRRRSAERAVTQNSYLNSHTGKPYAVDSALS